MAAQKGGTNEEKKKLSKIRKTSHRPCNATDLAQPRGSTPDILGSLVRVEPQPAMLAAGRVSLKWSWMVPLGEWLAGKMGMSSVSLEEWP